MSKEAIDKQTIAYLEKLTKKKGMHAVDAWMKFTGWKRSTVDKNGKISGIQTTIDERLENARRHAQFDKIAKLAS